MTFSFYPLGIPFSSSFSVSASFVQNMPAAGVPTSASLAEYVTNYIGPTGSVYETVNVLRLV